ncbi:MAG TPA: hypothetical protein DF774_07630 [Rheinheimera sp.]|nr:hypothetical protein [Rheinheimera sp.]
MRFTSSTVRQQHLEKVATFSRGGNRHGHRRCATGYGFGYQTVKVVVCAGQSLLSAGYNRLFMAFFGSL